MTDSDNPDGNVINLFAARSASNEDPLKPLASKSATPCKHEYVTVIEDQSRVACDACKAEVDVIWWLSRLADEWNIDKCYADRARRDRKDNEAKVAVLKKDIARLRGQKRRLAKSIEKSGEQAACELPMSISVKRLASGRVKVDIASRVLAEHGLGREHAQALAFELLALLDDGEPAVTPQHEHNEEGTRA